MDVPCSRFRLWWWVGNYMYSLLQSQEQEQICSFPDTKSHQHPETDHDSPKDQAPSCAALLGSKRGWCCCPTPGVVSWLAGEGRKHFAGEATFFWQKIIPQSWYPAAFGETATGFHLSKLWPKLFILSHLALQCKNDSPSPKISGNNRFRMCLKQIKKLYLLI